MAYDEGLAERLRDLFADRQDIAERKMFGGITFMLGGNMCCGIVNETMMARVGPAEYEKALAAPFASEMDFTGRAMKGFVFVSPEGFESDDNLHMWVHKCESFAASLPPK